MIELLGSATTLAEAIGNIDARLATGSPATGSPQAEAERWRLRGVRRCLVALGQNPSVADRGALLRELTRLADGHARIPLALAGLGREDLQTLRRFGLAARLADDGGLSLLLDDSDLPTTLAQVLRLDPLPRRPYPEAIPDAALLRLTPFQRYRTPTQKAAVRALVTMPPASTLSVTMPTGSGKSLLFQLGTLWWREDNPYACTVVIVPTIALAHDHERTLRAIPGLESCQALTGEMGLAQREELFIAFNQGKVPILLLSPELALGGGQEHLLVAARAPEDKPSAARARLVTLFIDEAHIIDSWGRSFRPDFQRLPGLVGALRKHNPSLRVVALSATLGEQARDEIRRAYAATMPGLFVDAEAPRYEFDLLFESAGSAEHRDDSVLRYADRVPRPCILYTTEVAHARGLYQRLRSERGYQRIALFTGEIEDSAERRRIVHAWSADQLDLVVATSAFGLGVDKSDVRTVLHACVPEGTARYYQEIGRASRDGHQGLALCVWHRARASWEKDDLRTAYGLATRQWLTVEMAISRWQAILHEAKAAARFHWQDGRPYLDVPLDAWHPGLVQSSDYNRRWNMALLNQLQRAGAVQIQSPQDEDLDPAVWRVELCDPRAYEDSEEGRAYLAATFAMRELEQQRAKADLRALEDALTGRAHECVLVTIFREVEAGRPEAGECGRCTWCRANGVAPPQRVAFGGLNQCWPTAPEWCHGQLPAGTVVIHPRDPHYGTGLEGLLSRLARSGVEQYMVPDGLGIRAAQALATLPIRAGLVLETGQLLDGSGWRLANLPTAVLLAGNSLETDAVYRRCCEWLAANLGQTLILVAAPSQQLQGRPLPQIASSSAPHDETTLDDWALPPSGGARHHK